MSWWHIGAKCVCIEGDNWRSTEDGPVRPGPKVNEVCRIRAIILHDGNAYFCLEGHGELGYRAECFRPVAYPKQSIETDIAQFMPLLTTRELVE